MLLAILVLAPLSGPAQEKSGTRENLLANGSFEKGLDGWNLQAFDKIGTAAPDTVELRDGRPTLRIQSSKGDDTFVTQKVNVKPNTRYRLSGYIKTKDIVPDDRKNKAGANLSLSGGFEHPEHIQKTNPWAKVQFEFDSGGKTEITIGPRLGHYSSKVAGTAWFADLELVEIGRARR